MTPVAARVSIIIPSYNEAVGIVVFLDKLQRFRPHCELILVDGGSDDNTLMLANSRVDYMLQSIKGRAVQMNAGAAKANGSILLFLHADTFLPSQAIDEIQTAIRQNFQWGRFDIVLTGKSTVLPVVAWMMNHRSCLTRIATGDQAIFIQTTLFKKIGGFANIALMEDIALSKTLKKYPPYCIKYKVKSSGRRWLQFGVFKTILLMWCLRLRYFLGAEPYYLEQLYRQGKFWKT